MNRVRRGKDFKVLWSFFDYNGEPYQLDKTFLTLYVSNSFDRFEVTDFSVEENTITWIFRGKDQKALGDYTLELIQNNGTEGMIPIDSVDAFTLVQYSRDESLCGGGNVKIEDVTVNSTLDIETISSLIDAQLSEISVNPVQNKVITAALNNKADKSSVPTKTSQLTNDSGFITAEEVPVPDWNASTYKEGHIKNRTHHMQDYMCHYFNGSPIKISKPSDVGYVLLTYDTDLSEKFIRIEIKANESKTEEFLDSMGMPLIFTWDAGNSTINVQSLGGAIETYVMRAYYSSSAKGYDEYFVALDEGFIPEEVARKSELKTINGQSILGEGDIEIEGSKGSSNFVTDFTVNDLYALVYQGAAPKPIHIEDLQRALENNERILVPYGSDEFKGYSLLQGYYEDLVYFTVTDEMGGIYVVEVGTNAVVIDRDNITHISQREIKSDISELQQKDAQTDAKLAELSAEIADVSEEVTKSASAFSGTMFKLIKGSYVATSGAIVADGAAYRTDYVDVTATFKIKGRGSFYGNGLVLAFFDKDKNFINDGWVRGSDGNPMKDLDSYIPAKAQYAIVSAYGATNAELSYLQTTGLIGLAKKDVHKKVLVFGDSITETQTITFASEENPYSLIYKTSNTNWVDYFQKQQNGLVQFDEVRNYARSGARFIKVSGGQEARQFIGFQIDEAISDLNAPSDGYFYGKDFLPDIIVVSMGTNDYETASSKSYEDAMARSIMSGSDIDVDATIENLRNSIFAETVRKSFMRIKKQFPLAKCYMCLPLQRKATEFPSEILECLRKMSARYGFTIIDCYGESGITRDFADVYLSDGLHPNSAGKELMGRFIVNRILADYHY